MVRYEKGVVETPNKYYPYYNIIPTLWHMSLCTLRFWVGVKGPTPVIFHFHWLVTFDIQL